MGNPDCIEPGGRLSPELAGRLEPELQDALDHPLRREILRNLHESERGRTPAELAPRLGPVSISQVNYHVQVLTGDGAVVPVGDSASGGRFYVSDLSREPEVAEVLRVTQLSDRKRRRAAEAGDLHGLSSGAGR